MHGRQIRDTSINLVKINPATSQLLTLQGTTKIQQYAAPTLGIDLANKDYVDAVASGLDVKVSCRAATIIPLVSLIVAPAAIDGITLAAGDRVLIKNQSIGEDNGIYIFNGAGNPFTRSADAATDSDVTSGMFTFIEEGTNAGTGWILVTYDPITLGVTPLLFSQFSAAGMVTASNGLTKVVNDIRLGGLLTSNTAINGANIYTFAVSNSDFTFGSFLNEAVVIGSGPDIEIRGLNNVAINGNDLKNSIKIFGTGQSVSDLSTNNHMVVRDDEAGKGLVYAADYSANFTDNSLITKRYMSLNAGAISTKDNKAMVAMVTTAAGQQIASAIITTPKLNGYVQVFINGVKYEIGDATTASDVYFAAVGTLGTPKAIEDIAAGDVLVRGSLLFFDTDATDVVDYDYAV